MYIHAYTYNIWQMHVTSSRNHIMYVCNIWHMHVTPSRKNLMHVSVYKNAYIHASHTHAYACVSVHVCVTETHCVAERHLCTNIIRAVCILACLCGCVAWKLLTQHEQMYIYIYIYTDMHVRGFLYACVCSHVHQSEACV
jgi:hypothetical protein